jgi:hypothetical protein
VKHAQQDGSGSGVKGLYSLQFNNPLIWMIEATYLESKEAMTVAITFNQFKWSENSFL